MVLPIPSEKISHCIIFFCAWTAWVFSVISLASYNWIAENIGSINGPYTRGLFMERATCSLCQPLLDTPPFIYVTRFFMVFGCICGFAVCVLDVLIVLKFPASQKLKTNCVVVLCASNCCTLIAVATFQGLGTSLLTVPENLLQPYGYGLVLAWCCWVLHLPAVPLVVFEAWYRNREPDNDEPSHSSSSRPSSHSRVRPTAEM